MLLQWYRLSGSRSKKIFPDQINSVPSPVWKVVLGTGFSFANGSVLCEIMTVGLRSSLLSQLGVPLRPIVMISAKTEVLTKPNGVPNPVLKVVLGTGLNFLIPVQVGQIMTVGVTLCVLSLNALAVGPTVPISVKKIFRDRNQ